MSASKKLPLDMREMMRPQATSSIVPTTTETPLDMPMETRMRTTVKLSAVTTEMTTRPSAVMNATTKTKLAAVMNTTTTGTRRARVETTAIKMVASRACLRRLVTTPAATRKTKQPLPKTINIYHTSQPQARPYSVPRDCYQPLRHWLLTAIGPLLSGVGFQTRNGTLRLDAYPTPNISMP